MKIIKKEFFSPKITMGIMKVELLELSKPKYFQLNYHMLINGKMQKIMSYCSPYMEDTICDLKYFKVHN